MGSNQKNQILIRIFILFLILVSLAAGILMFVLGIKNLYKDNSFLKNENFESAIGVIYATREHQTGTGTDRRTTYSLIYTYTVNDIQYFVETQYAVGYSQVPKQGTERTIRYNPENPEEAVVVEVGSGVFLFAVGLLFLPVSLIALVILVKSILIYIKNFRRLKEETPLFESSSEVAIKSKRTPLFKKLDSEKIGFVIFVAILFVLSFFFYLLGRVGKDSLNPFKGIDAGTIIPMIVFIVGTLLIFVPFIRRIKFKKRIVERVILRVDNIEYCNDNSHNFKIIFTSFKGLYAGYDTFVYKTNKVFKKDELYIVNLNKHGVFSNIEKTIDNKVAILMTKFKNKDFHAVTSFECEKYLAKDKR